MTNDARPVVLAAPSGTGKTTIAHRLVDESADFVFSVSTTTRRRREGEVDGTDYQFVDRVAFESMVAAGEMAEWAEVHGQLYGTPRANLDAARRRGEHAVLDIDVQGAAQIRESVPDAIRVFVLPPSAPEMLRRIGVRGTERPEEVARRLRTALRELNRVHEFQHVIVNDDLDRAVQWIRDLVADPEGVHYPKDLDERVRVLREEIRDILSEEFAHTSR